MSTYEIIVTIIVGVPVLYGAWRVWKKKNDDNGSGGGGPGGGGSDPTNPKNRPR